MYRQLILRQFIKSELERYKVLEHKYRQDLAVLPKGSITKTKEDKFYRIYRDSGKQIKRKLTSDDNELLASLRKRRQAKSALPYIADIISMYEFILNNEIIYDPIAIESTLPEQYRDPASSYMFLPGDINPVVWENSSYNSNDFHSEALIHVTEAGILTRSKSEAFIGTQLERHNLPYRYEPELDLGFRKIYPDFAVFLPEERRVVYWEHFGLVDNPAYMMNALHKIDDYIKAGYYPGINLIITYETKEQPLTIATINEKIEDLMGV